METDHPKWREEIITGWKADQDEDVNIDDSDDDEGKVVTDKLQQPELPRALILLGGKKEVNLPWKDKRTPPPLHTSNIDLTHLRLAWVKVNDEGLWWPAKIVAETEVPPEILKPFLPVHGKIVHLFHSEKNLQPYQVVKRSSCIYPFEQYYNLWKNLKDAPEFTAAVSEAYNLFCRTTQSSTTVKESLSTPRKNAVTIDEEDATARMEDKVPPPVTAPRNNNEVEAEAHDSTHTHRSSINETSTETESPETVIELQVVAGTKQMRKSTVCLQGRNHVREKKTTCVNDAAPAQYVHERLSLDVEILVQEKGGQSSETDGAAAARELAMGSSEEESMHWMAEYNHLCQQRCTFGDVLFYALLLTEMNHPVPWSQQIKMSKITAVIIMGQIMQQLKKKQVCLKSQMSS
ncbi:hypothetical protein CY35_02G056500 [Sphagnum magellanicum]|nr:hypothetical protein CY35_02G056500 [Sphagnum magellanicum]